MKKFLFLLLAMLLILGATACANALDIPIISLYGECLIDYTNWNNKDTYGQATLTYNDSVNFFSKNIEIKPQGTSSLLAPKKNFTIKFSEGVKFVDAWGAQSKYVLKADYIDPTCSGNVVSAKLAAEINKTCGLFTGAPNYGVIDGYPVWVRINDEDAGLYNMTIPKDAWMFGMDENNPNHMVLSCEGWSDASKMLTSEIDYELDWSFEVGEATDESKAAFERMVNFVATADDKTFVEDFDQYLNLDACINYLCYVNIAKAHDNISKNMLMVTYNGKVWAPVLYDLDSLWGIGYDGLSLVESEGEWTKQIITDENNLLFRINHLFGDKVRERYWHLRNGILSKEHIMEAFETYTAPIPESYYEINTKLWNARGSRIRSLELMSQLMDSYLPTVDKLFEVPAAAVPSSETPKEVSAPVSRTPSVNYVWNTNGIQHTTYDPASLPVSMHFNYALNGEPISVDQLAGKSGQVDISIRVERKAGATDVYGVAALVYVDANQVSNLQVVGGTYENAADDYVFMGKSCLFDTNTSYELIMRMDATNFEPAKYMVTVSPVMLNAGYNNLEVLPTACGQLITLVGNGVDLHTSISDSNVYLTNISSALTALSASVQGMISAEEAAPQDEAAAAIESLLKDAEAYTDWMLTQFGYEILAEATTQDRINLLSAAAESAELTEDDKKKAASQIELLNKYLAIANKLNQTESALRAVNQSLMDITSFFPDLVGVYSFANDQLYSIFANMYTLCENLANYYYAYNGAGSVSYDPNAFSAWYDVIIFSNLDTLVTP